MHFAKVLSVLAVNTSFHNWQKQHQDAASEKHLSINLPSVSPLSWLPHDFSQPLACPCQGLVCDEKVLEAFSSLSLIWQYSVFVVMFAVAVVEMAHDNLVMV